MTCLLQQRMSQSTNHDIQTDLYIIIQKRCSSCRKETSFLNALTEVLEWLKSGKKLPEKYCDHQLKGKLKKFRELHIQPDWILVYIKNKTELILTLSRTGTHADLLRLQKKQALLLFHNAYFANFWFCFIPNWQAIYLPCGLSSKG